MTIPEPTYHRLTPDRWKDVEGLFGPKGGCARAIGWCAVAPREEYSRLARSRVLKPVDDKEVWSVVCFFIRSAYRKKGISAGLLKAAVEFAAERGAKIVEGYPIEPKSDSYPPVYAWTGFAGAFKKTGFKEVERRSLTRPIMRYEI